MSAILSAYNAAFSVFFAGMPEDIASLAVCGLALAVNVLFAALPILIIRKGMKLQ